MLPEIGTASWRRMVAFMRINFETDFGFTRLEMTVREMLESHGRDFDAEFEKWKKKGEEIVIQTTEDNSR